jgi:polyisoprenyl-teichoic acid--peptidoglycan teichoic acid transferase
LKLAKILLSFGIIILTAFAVRGMLMDKADDGRDNSHEPGEVSPSGREGKVIQSESSGSSSKQVNVLLAGLDDDETRADVIILLNYDSKDKKINMLSIPRDTKVKIKGETKKINALYGIGQEGLLAKAVEQLTELPVDYYLSLNFKGFREFVDTLGGVIIDVPVDMKYDDPTQNLHIDIKKGRQLLDGRKAEHFVRYRKGNKRGEGYEDGDIGRISMQHVFLKELISQKLKLRYISSAYEIFLILRNNMNTNIKPGDIRGYIGDIISLDMGDVNMYTAPGESVSINGIWYYICDIQETRKIIEENF